MPTNPSALSVISTHLEKFASCPAPAQSSSSSSSRLKSLGSESNNNSIDLNLSANAKLVLMTKIDFQKAEIHTSTSFNEQLRAKYVHLKPSSQQNSKSSPNLTSSKEQQPSTSNGVVAEPQPKRVLYPPERVTLQWRRQVPIGAGLVNCGNTCFLNSTLQALTHTAPLYNYLVCEQHAQNCRISGFCMLCEMERLMVRCFGSTNRAIQPESILQKLHVIAKHLRLGRQEDAHEFLRFSVEKMQQACLNGLGKLDPEVKETTAMNAIFGGSIKSTVICQTCTMKSEKIDPIMDLCLELKHATTLQQALEHFIKPEMLTGDNAYKCPTCKKPQPARKMLSVNKAPNILTFQLKRFGMGGFSMFGGAKITRPIEFHEKFNMRHFMSSKAGPDISYSLYAVVVHEGMTANSGHYYSYVKHSSQWYMMNDTTVKVVSARQVLASQAYILFYVRDAEGLENGCNNHSPMTTPVKPGTTTPAVSKLVTPTTANGYKPTTIPSSAPPIKMVIKLGGQNNPASKITSYTAQPLVAKRPAQPSLSATASTTTPVKIPTSPSTITAVAAAPQPKVVVTATRPLVEFTPSSSSDDDDDERGLVIDEAAPAGNVTTSMLCPKSERPKSPPLIKFVPNIVPTVTSTQQSPVAPLATFDPDSPINSEDKEISVKQNEEEEEDGQVSDSASPKKRKKKHRSEKHHKHHHSRKRRHSGDGEDEVNGVGEGEDNDDEESSSRSSLKKKKKRRHRDPHHHHRSEDEDDDDDSQEWVEKKQPEQPASSPFHKEEEDEGKKNYDVKNPHPFQPPNHQQQNGSSSYPLPPSYPSYNGNNGSSSNHHSMMNGAMPPSTAFSLGSHVASWDGGLNSIDAAASNGNGNSGLQQRLSAKEQWKRDYDASLDAGRIKKVKSHNNNGDFASSQQQEIIAPPANYPQLPGQNNGYRNSNNPFQAVQNSRLNEDRNNNSHGNGSRRNSAASSRVSSPDPTYTNGNGNVVNGQNHLNGHHYNGNNYFNGHQNGNNNNKNDYGDDGYNKDNNGYQHNHSNGYHHQNGDNKFSSRNHHHQNFSNNNSGYNRYNSPHQNGGGGFRKDHSHQHPHSAPRYNNNGWRGGGGRGGGAGNQNHGGYRRQHSMPYQ